MDAVREHRLHNRHSLFPHSGSFALGAAPFGSLGFISQDLATIAGHSYNIHVFYANSVGAPNEFRIRWGGTTVFDSVDEGAHDYTEIFIDPPATGAIMTLELGLRNDPGAFFVDDISVFDTGLTAVPAPATLSLVGLGLAALGLVRRRRSCSPR